MSASRSRLLSAPLQIEILENRLAPAWLATPPALVRVPSFRAVALDARLTGAGSAAIATTEVDYYRFTAPRTGSYRFSALTPTSTLDPVLGVFRANGTRLAFSDNRAVGDSDAETTVLLTAGQRYFLGVTNRVGSPGGAYRWAVQGPGPADDAFEDNDALSRATPLGTLESPLQLSRLILRDTADWFRFSMNGPGLSGDHVSLAFNHSLGDLDLRLYDAAGNLLRFSTGSTDEERIGLQGLPAGSYLVQVYGYKGATNPAYTLAIDPGQVAPAPPVHRVLYLNFDGVSLTHQELERYAGTDWPAFVERIDADEDGVEVSPLLASRPDREQIIARILALVQEDLQPFHLEVQRWTGKAMEDVGATTIFLGKASLTGVSTHISSDVDIGNDNRADISFVTNEDWGSVERTALALADVTLHEAGHTWGLWHVHSGTALESMGLRYSTPTAQWTSNTSFLDRTFVPFVGTNGQAHGPGPLNSYQTMAALFGGGSSNRAAGGSILVDASKSRVLAITTSPAGIDQIVLRRLASGNIELRINHRIYELQRGHRAVVIYTGGDRRDQVRIEGALGGLQVRVIRQAGAEVLSLGKSRASTVVLEAAQRDNSPCCCPLCQSALLADPFLAS